MRVIIQRVLEASVKVDDEITGQIKQGLLILVGFEPDDHSDDYSWMSKKIIQLRIFNDSEGIMNRSIQDIRGNILVVSQFTLHAATKKGNRPSYMKASPPLIAEEQYLSFLSELSSIQGSTIETGVFGADMKVELINDGPVTLFIDSKNKE